MCFCCRERELASGSSRAKGVRFQPSLSAVTEGSIDTNSLRSSLSSIAEAPAQSQAAQAYTQVI